MPLLLDRESLDREFPSRRVAIQMNHAAVCPLPARGAAALAGYAERIATRDAVLASYGVQDCRAMMATIDAAAVRRALVALPGSAGRPETARA